MKAFCILVTLAEIVYAIVCSIFKIVHYLLYSIFFTPKKELLYFKRSVDVNWGYGHFHFYKNGLDWLLKRNEIVSMRKEWHRSPEY